MYEAPETLGNFGLSTFGFSASALAATRPIACWVRDFDADAAILTVSGKTGSREIHLPPAAVTLFRQLASGKRPTSTF